MSPACSCKSRFETLRGQKAVRNSGAGLDDPHEREVAISLIYRAVRTPRSSHAPLVQSSR